ncbi:pantothenate kinase, type III [Thioflavicoccus mobilis 8321]|uniref:Type III pantothenate kinase n=1 Tax=Thioflavicoccus mobilis 8321 TaxID=765912 RepID=L0GVX8_9GAMM|nr:type III pantothenate kinase [Thioflavicoccus mobilis]AGA90141.1 pantothenate kinase, type III [Thioflavicoccus mobilis 8321]
MDLLLDIGNTSLRWALYADGRLGEVGAVRHFGGLPIDLLAAWEPLVRPTRVTVANVGGEAVADALTQVCQGRWGLAPRFVATQGDALGVKIAYVEPARLGVDRWLALLAAHHQFPGDALIVDAGTAVTFDLLAADGRHLGGLILPGVEPMRDTLLRGTQIPRLAVVDPVDERIDRPWADDTAGAIGAATIQAPAALAERLHRAFAERTGGAPRLLVTGGDGARLLPALSSDAEPVPDLVLRGLALVS